MDAKEEPVVSRVGVERHKKGERERERERQRETERERERKV